MSAEPEYLTISRAEYQDLVDARDHAIAMRQIATGGMATIADADMDAFLAAPTPLAFWRSHRSLSQAELAGRIGVTARLLAQAEDGHTPLTAEALLRAARVLGVRMEDLVAEEAAEV